MANIAAPWLVLVFMAFGLVGLKIALGETWAWTIHNGFAIFIVGGLIKAALAGALIPGAWRLVNRIDAKKP